MTELKPKQQRRIETAAAASKILPPGAGPGSQVVFDLIQLANYIENGWETISDDETEEMDDHPGDTEEAQEDGTADRGTYKCGFCGEEHPIADQTGGPSFSNVTTEELKKALSSDTFTASLGDLGRVSAVPFPGAQQIPVEPGSPLDKELRKALGDIQNLTQRDG